MASDKDNTPPKGRTKAETPEWANGLRQLYDSVVDEPIPDSFKDLLAKLDDDAGSGTGSDT
uniref:NepR family anti-sigma factor n=1 Tax=uncultured Erythrobacter sp. TaxID=263913 RepID=UPI00261EE548|nr:NepR family anti-sigma factor [uncultured Erythrobacter sp.]